VPVGPAHLLHPDTNGHGVALKTPRFAMEQTLYPRAERPTTGPRGDFVAEAGAVRPLMAEHIRGLTAPARRVWLELLSGGVKS